MKIRHGLIAGAETFAEAAADRTGGKVEEWSGRDAVTGEFSEVIRKGS
jgi:hypothetical protein